MALPVNGATGEDRATAEQYAEPHFETPQRHAPGCKRREREPDADTGVSHGQGSSAASHSAVTGGQ